MLGGPIVQCEILAQMFNIPRNGGHFTSKKSHFCSFLLETRRLIRDLVREELRRSLSRCCRCSEREGSTFFSSLQEGCRSIRRSHSLFLSRCSRRLHRSHALSHSSRVSGGSSRSRSPPTLSRHSSVVSPLLTGPAASSVHISLWLRFARSTSPAGLALSINDISSSL